MTMWWQAGDEHLLAALRPAQTALHAAHRELLELVAEVHRRGLGTGSGYRSTAELLHLTQHVSRSVAQARVDAAEDVLPGRAPSGEEIAPALPGTAAAVAEDAVSAEHVVVVRAVLAALPAHLEVHRAGLEADLAGWARRFDPSTVRRLGRRALEVLDPDGPEPRDPDPVRTRLSLTAQGDGYQVSGWLDREAHATVMTALGPLSRPAAAAAGPVDGGGGGMADRRTTAERLGAGLVELASRALAGGGLPTAAGERPHLVVTIGLDELETGRGPALLDLADGTLPGVVAAEDARRLGCDARRSWIRLGECGEVLDIGRGDYVVPRRMRRALHVRDRGCAFPGCTVPAVWTDAHHVRHWADGGATAIDNLVLLCGHHHTLLHRGEWAVEFTGGVPTFRPPWWMGSGPRGNGVHRPDLRAGPLGRPARTATCLG